ncbi:beta-galactosidase/beta-glucuronidase [Thozetella sp. PMI_491]|nr:beta-galactosidase/beta-glucuronidase [Thozetella sp. PMI_491]
MAFPDSRPDWNNLEVLQRNRLPARAHFYNYDSEETALTFNPRESLFYHSLNGRWKFCHHLSPFEAPDWKDADPNSWDDIIVPGMWQLQGYGHPHYTNVNYPFPVDPPNVPYENESGSYFRDFIVPENWDVQTQSIRLRFEGVDSSYHVWINGEEVGYSQGSRNAAEFDITKHLKRVNGSINNLAVRVYKFCDGSYIEDQDQWWLSGIFRDVYLIAFPRSGINDFTITTTLDDAFSNAKIIATKCGDAAKFQLKLLSPDGRTLGQEEAEETATLRISTPNLTLWSAEQPFLYTVLLICGFQVIPQRIGIRRVEMRDGNILLNDRPIMFYGVNRHEHHPTLGRAVPYEFMRRDLINMKRYNINAIRTSHQPNDPRMYELADELGFYVINEADLECHGFYKPEQAGKWTSGNPAWEAAYLDRAIQLVERFKNSTCTIIWSMGNEAFWGENLAAMARWVKVRDPTRLVHYEADLEATITDIYSRMYCTLEELRDLAAEKQDKPLILCEYAHAMGNGPGGLKDYIDVFRREKSLQGGFIWQWANHGFLNSTKDGRPYFAHGGDFGDTLNDGSFFLDGMMWSDHTPGPALVEYKKVIEPVTVEGLDYAAGKVSLHNHFFFSCLSHLNCWWSITVADEVPTQSSILVLPYVAPGSTESVELPAECVRLLHEEPSLDKWLNLSFQLKCDSPWAAAGHEVAWAQVSHPASLTEIMTSRPVIATLHSSQENDPKIPTVVQEPGRLILSTRDNRTKIKFDLVRGGLEWVADSGVVVARGPELSIYRAMTQNDLGFGGDGAEWQRCMLNRVRTFVIKTTWDQGIDTRASRGIRVTSYVRIGPPALSWAVRAKLEYIVSPSLATISVHVTGDIERQETTSPWPSVLPRIGLDLSMPKSYNHVRWFGRGPGESYRDKKEAARVGLYAARIDDLFVPYEVPQENGSRCDVRWVKLEATGGAVGSPTLEARMVGGSLAFTARKYIPQELDRAEHPHDLRASDEVSLHLDYLQHGLGSGSCGPPPFDHHRAVTGPFDFTMELRLLSQRE